MSLCPLKLKIFSRNDLNIEENIYNTFNVHYRDELFSTLTFSTSEQQYLKRNCSVFPSSEESVKINNEISSTDRKKIM